MMNRLFDRLPEFSKLKSTTTEKNLETGRIRVFIVSSKPLEYRNYRDSSGLTVVSKKITEDNTMTRKERRRQNKLHDRYDMQNRQQEMKDIIDGLKKELYEEGATDEIIEDILREKYIRNTVRHLNGSDLIADSMICSMIHAKIMLKLDKVTTIMGMYPHEQKKIDCIVCHKDAYASGLFTEKPDSDKNQRGYIYIVCKDHFSGYIHDENQKQKVLADIETVIEGFKH